MDNVNRNFDCEWLSEIISIVSEWGKICFDMMNSIVSFVKIALT